MSRATAMKLAISVVVLVAGVVRPASAQSISDVLGFLITNQSIQTGSLDRDREAAQATRETLARALLANLATLPVGTSSGAFVYRLNPSLGTVERATRSFGPFFVERAMTNGRNAGSIGLTLQHLRFTSLDGRNLRDGTLVTLANRFVDEAEPFDVDRLALDLNADVATVYGSIGLLDRLEVGLALPLILLRITGSRMNVYRDRTFTQATASATALGFADAIVHTKYALISSEGRAVAAAADLRLPNGREQDLLGSGRPSLKLTGLASLERQAISSHVSAGWTVGGLEREVSYAGAVAIAASDRITLTAELLGRAMTDGGHITAVSARHPTLPGVETIRLQPDNSGLHLVTLVPGIKWNLADTWVLTASISLPLTSGGLTAPFTPLMGLEYGVQWW